MKKDLYAEDLKPSINIKDKKALKIGTNIEMEHTNNRSIAKTIASQHLEENNLYYDKKVGLPAMEERLKKMELNKEALMNDFVRIAFIDEMEKIAACKSHIRYSKKKPAPLTKTSTLFQQAREHMTKIVQKEQK